MALQDARGPLNRRGVAVALGGCSFLLTDDKGVGADHGAVMMLQAGIQTTSILAQAEPLC